MAYSIHRDNTDVEVLILDYELPSPFIELYTDRKNNLTGRQEEISKVKSQIEKLFGLSMQGTVNLKLKNENHAYTVGHASSIFSGQQMLRDWLRIRCGWGDQYSRNIATQFYGKLDTLDNTFDRKATINCYDALKDLFTTEVDEDDGLTINSAVVPSMTPMDILDYLIRVKYNLQWFNIDSGTFHDLLDATALSIADANSDHIEISTTVWSNGTKLINMVNDILKVCAAYIYAGKDGKLYPYVHAPSYTAVTPTHFYGDETGATRHNISIKRSVKLDSLINVVGWTYGQENRKYVASAPDSVTQYGERARSLSTGWEVFTDDLDAAAQVLFLKYADEDRLSLYAAQIVWAMDGLGLAVELTELILLTDESVNAAAEKVQVVAMEADLHTQNTTMLAEDAAHLDNKYGWISSEVDEGDGLGITAGNFAVNWRLRFLFACNAPSDDPHSDGSNPAFDPSGNNNGVINPGFGTPDAWGNGIEEPFITW